MSFDASKLVCVSIIDEIGQKYPNRVERVPYFVNARVEVVQVRDVLFIPDLKIQIVDGFKVPLEAIFDDWNLSFEQSRNFSGAGNKLSGELSPDFINEDVCILSNFYSRSFGHWTEELIKVMILERYGFSGKYVINKLPEVALDSLNLIGVKRNRVITEVSSPSIFRSAFFTTAIDRERALLYPEVFMEFRRLLFDAISYEQHTQVYKRLWLERGARSFNKGGDLVNEDEVYSCIERYGFKVVDMGILSLRQQISMMYNADVLSGPHGSAFVHAQFMRERSTVIECFSPMFINPSNIEICRLLKHKYFMVISENTPYVPYPYEKNIYINLSLLELILQNID
jgi:capsular polysaccharide biosynthesis protein